MRKSLTRKEILRRKYEIAELFTKPQNVHRSSFATSYLAERLESYSETWHSFLRAIGESPCCISGDLQHAGLRLLFVVKRAELEAEKGSCRVLISPTKRLGTAVQRNYAKRLQREFYRHSKVGLYEISRYGFEAAAEQFLRVLSSAIRVSVEEREQFYGVLRNLQHDLFYRWGFVIFRSAAVEDRGARHRTSGAANGWGSELSRSSEGFSIHRQWQAQWLEQAEGLGRGLTDERGRQRVADSAFLLELERYQSLLDQLGRKMQKKCFQHLQQLWEFTAESVSALEAEALLQERPELDCKAKEL